MRRKSRVETADYCDEEDLIGEPYICNANSEMGQIEEDDPPLAEDISQR